MKLRTLAKRGLWKMSPVLFNALSADMRSVEFSIGVATAENIASNQRIDLVNQICEKAKPVLSRSSVTDIPAEFVADPFIINVRNTWFMFFEIMNRLNYLGCIGYATSPDGINWRYEKVALKEPFHLAYPHVFQDNDQVFMIPDSIGNGVRLYRADSFPSSWRYEKTLIDNPALCDSSIFRHQGRWWALCCELANDRHILRIYFADSLQGQWHEHTAGRITKPMNQRQAGRVVDIDGQLYRFVQNQEGNYAEYVCMRRIDKLTPTEFKESDETTSPLLGASGNGWNADGMHHIDLCFSDQNSFLASVDGVRRA